MTDPVKILLSGDTLSLQEVVNIARGAAPWAELRRGTLPLEWELRYKNLRTYALSAELEAFGVAKPKDLRVRLVVLASFATKQDEQWQWLKDLCQQWTSVRGVDAHAIEFDNPENVQHGYLPFMNRAAKELGLNEGTKLTKQHIENWLQENWPEELMSPSARDLSSMATFLRDPRARTGGHFKA
jgi:hypothetical protein